MRSEIPQVRFAGSRLLVAKAFLDCAQNIGKLVFENPDADIPMADMLILVAIFIGQAENRPLTASDISVYLGLPRATVVRRLKAISSSRGLRSIRDGNRVLFYFDDVNGQPALLSFAERLKTLQTVFHRLSKLDRKEIDDLMAEVYTEKVRDSRTSISFGAGCK